MNANQIAAKILYILHFSDFCQKLIHMTEQQFNPNSAARQDAGLFGLPFDADQSQIIIIPVEWELTVSYGKGTAGGPQAVREASMQMDLNNHDFPELWKAGIWMDEWPLHLRDLHDKMVPLADTIISAAEIGELDEHPKKFARLYEVIAQATQQKNLWLKERIKYWKAKGKIVGLLGGDHSIPLAYHQFFEEEGIRYGILMVDAHMDLRNAYEGFQYSHASIFYNVLQMKHVEKMVQVGIRDYCHEEAVFAASIPQRVKVFFDRDLRRQQFEGMNWKNQVDSILDFLPDQVYLSVDIDGLDPRLCPNTGTPVPGGLQFEELMYLINRVKESGKTVVGFDLCEVSPGADEWDGNVGSRVLFQLCGAAAI
jgi:agmatinase